MSQSTWMVSGKLTSKGQITLPKSIRTQLRLKEGDLVGFSIEKEGRVYLEKIGYGLICPACEGHSIKKDTSEEICLLCQNTGLLYQSTEAEWLLLATSVAQWFQLQLQLRKDEKGYVLDFEGKESHPKEDVILKVQPFIENQLNQCLVEQERSY